MTSLSPRGQARWITPLAIGLGAFAVLTALGTLALDIVNRAWLPNIDSADPNSIFVPVGIAVVGAVVASRRPGNATGWLLLCSAIVTGLLGFEDQYAVYALLTHRGLPGANWALWLNNWTFAFVSPAGAVGLLVLLLPDGRLPSRRWRPVAIACVGTSVPLALIGMFAVPTLQGNQSNPYLPQVPNPLHWPALPNALQYVDNAFYFAGLALLLAAASAPLLRMRRARGEDRQQLKWIAYAVIVTAAAVVAANTVGLAIPPPGGQVIADAVTSLGFGLLFPAAVGIAILRYRLFDIDVVISRTLVYTTLAVFITAVYVGIAVGIGAAVGGGGKPNLGLSIVATAIVAVGFQPVRERVQRVANRLVYGKRATPYEVLAQFSERAAESYAMDDVLPRMARVLAEGTGAQRADVWLRTGMSWTDGAVWPADGAQRDAVTALDGELPAAAAGERVIEVRHQGVLLGALSITKRAGESLSPVEENLVSHLAGQAGLVLRNVGLTTDLQARLEELRASRQRLVSAQDEERRKLERNLHDGAQQHLVALKVKLGLVEMLATRDPEKAKVTLAQLKGDADEALETLRDLARGIYPPLLADKGLAVALASQARKATVPVTVDAEGTTRYPQDVEAAVYFCCLEALQNIQKYAHATRVRIRLRHSDAELRCEIEDDGDGFDVATTVKGAGLSNMVDRFDALGGEVVVTSAVGRGTRVVGVLPVSPLPSARFDPALPTSMRR